MCLSGVANRAPRGGWQRLWPTAWRSRSFPPLAAAEFFRDEVPGVVALFDLVNDLRRCDAEGIRGSPHEGAVPDTHSCAGGGVACFGPTRRSPNVDAAARYRAA